MSLTMMALRICAVQALKAAGTYVGDNVLDSQNSAFDLTADGLLTSDQQKPFIAVYTDAAKAQDLGAAGPRTNGRVDILFNCGVSQTMAVTDKATGTSEIVEGFPATDANFEALLDVLDIQIVRALVDPQNPWAQIFGGFVTSYVSKEMVRSGSTFEQVRIAAGQVKLTVDVFPDPAFGQVLPDQGHWGQFLAQMEADGLAQLSLFQQMLGDGVEAPYANFEALTGMPSRDAGSLELYSFGGVAKTVVVTDLAIDEGAA